MSHYKPYPAYKDSGVEWLGRVPEHWEVRPLGYEIELLTGYAFPSEKFDFEDGTPLVRGDNVTEGALRWGEKARFWQQMAPELDRFLLEERDVLIGMDGSKVGKNYAMVTAADLPLLLVQRVARLRAIGGVTSNFIYRLIGSPLFRAWVDLVRTDPAIPHISPKDISSFPIPVPSLAEQGAVLAHLDRETARIDALIEKKTRFIELLREKRQALITHAVTKGLDPNVKMKDSGVEWLGVVPEHWDVLQLRHTARLESGHTPSRSKPEYWVDCTVPWFTLADVWQVRSGEQKYVSETSEKVSQLGLDNSSARLLPAGSVFLSRTASVGFPGIMAVDMATSQDFAVWTCTSELSNEYLYYVLLGMKPDFDRLMMGSTHKTIYMPDIEAIRIARPPFDEQRGIVKALSGQLGRFKAVIDKTERSIELLKERRSALITAAVTGQIDLRESA